MMVILKLGLQLSSKKQEKATFYSQYPGGLLKYVHDLESIYAQLATLNAKLDEEDQLRCLFSQLEGMNTVTTDFLSQYC